MVNIQEATLVINPGFPQILTGTSIAVNAAATFVITIGIRTPVPINVLLIFVVIRDGVSTEYPLGSAVITDVGTDDLIISGSNTVPIVVAQGDLFTLKLRFSSALPIPPNTIMVGSTLVGQPKFISIVAVPSG